MTVKIKKSKHLQIEPEAKHFSKTFLIIQRIGFTIMFCIIMAALFGMFGNGLLSYHQKHDGILQINYEKFIRLQSTNVININLFNKCNKENIISISKNYFKGISIKSIKPTPSKELTTNNTIQFYFACTSGDSAQIIIVIEPESFGLLQGDFEINNNKVHIKQFVYP